MDEKGKAKGIIIFPRDTQRRAHAGGLYCSWDDGDQVNVRSEGLPALLQKHEAHLLAL